MSRVHLAFALPLALFLAFWALCHMFGGLVGVIKLTVKARAGWVGRSRLGKWTTKHSGALGSYAPILLVIALGGIAAIGAGYLFVELTEQVRLATSGLNHVDQAVHAWFEHERQPGMTALLSTVTRVGGTIGLGTLVGIVVVILLMRKERASAIFVVVTVGSGMLLNLGLKLIFARKRPDLATAIAVARWYSFPSGHAMNSFIVFGALSYIALRQHWQWTAKSACVAIGMTMIVLIGLSRVYLGVHWTSDIAGGWSAGTVWLASAMVAFEMLLRLRERRRGAKPSSPTKEVPDRPIPSRKAKA